MTEKERPLDPPEGEFPAKEHSEADLRCLAEDKLMKEIEEGDACELVECITTTAKDYQELMGTILLNAISNEHSCKEILIKRYLDTYRDKLEEELDEKWVAECVNRRDNPTGA